MEQSILNDEYYMKVALNEAKLAFDKGEIPVGAVIVSRDRIIAKSHNQTEQLGDFTAHAEMLAYTSASEYLSSKYLNNCTLYVTLEPCAMCAGASAWTQIGKIVYGASDEKRGFSKSKPSLLHPKTEVVSGILESECAALILDFFNLRRTKK
jgi:tRNA(adenine34) deaminase